MVSAVKADASLTAAVSTRVYPDVAPIGAALPHLTWELTGGGPLQHSTGSGPDNQVTVRWTVRATTRQQARTIADLLASVLDGWSETKDDPQISSCTLDNESGDWDYRSDDSDEIIRIIEQDYTIWFA